MMVGIFSAVLAATAMLAALLAITLATKLNNPSEAEKDQAMAAGLSLVFGAIAITAAFSSGYLAAINS